MLWKCLHKYELNKYKHNEDKGGGKKCLCINFFHAPVLQTESTIRVRGKTILAIC